MPLTIRSIAQRAAQMLADLQSSTGQVIPPIVESWDNTWATTIAGMAKTVELAIPRAAQDVLPNKTQNEEVLQVYSGWANTSRGDSVQTRLNITGTGTPAATIGGGVSGEVYTSEDGQKFYFPDDVTIPATGVVETVIEAFLSGAQANLRKGTLYTTGQNPDISAELTIAESDPIAREGRDPEQFEAWRANVDRGLKRPILADNYSYFYQTARETPGGEVAAAYPYVERPGQIALYIRGRTDDGVPSAQTLVDVDNWFRGVTDNVVRIPPHYEGVLPDDASALRFLIFACTNQGFAVRVTGMSPDNEATRALVGQDIVDWFATREPFVRGVSIYNNGILDKKALTSVVQNRVELGDIQSFTDVNFSTSGGAFTPITSRPLGKGELASTTTGDISWPAS